MRVVCPVELQNLAVLACQAVGRRLAGLQTGVGNRSGLCGKEQITGSRALHLAPPRREPDVTAAYKKGRRPREKQDRARSSYLDLTITDTAGSLRDWKSKRLNSSH